MDILIDIRCNEPLNVDKIEALATFVLSREQAPEDLELSISYVEKSEIQELNATYRGINAPTDVLSFECDDVILGDIIICPDVAREHALDFSSTFEHEMALMLTHGILHLLGYDHLDDDEAEAMEARENAHLAAWFASAR
jgi:probable rRNA maturation factor